MAVTDWGQAMMFLFLGSLAGAIIALAFDSPDENCTVIDKIVSTTTTVVVP